MGPKLRWWLLLTSVTQSLLIFVSSILLYTSAVSTEDRSNLGLVVLLAFTFGSQAAAGRPLGVAPITTVVVTSAMVDLWADKKLFAPLADNTGRNQRIAFILTFFVGGLVGGFALARVNTAFVLLLAGIFKMVAVIPFLIANGKRADALRQEVVKPIEEANLAAAAAPKPSETVQEPLDAPVRVGKLPAEV